MKLKSQNLYVANHRNMKISIIWIIHKNRPICLPNTTTECHSNTSTCILGDSKYHFIDTVKYVCQKMPTLSSVESHTNTKPAAIIISNHTINKWFVKLVLTFDVDLLELYRWPTEFGYNTSRLIKQMETIWNRKSHATGRNIQFG